ncbi:MAG: hypothetical protein MJ237_07950 [bacterium]|nr:hypothetical protein [bacterium]
MSNLNNYEKQIIKEMESEYKNTVPFPECEELLLFLHSLFIVTGQLDFMFCNAFVEEAIHFLKNALFLYRDGLYDCAFYSVRGANEVINNMLYLTKDISMKKAWKEKDYFPMDKKLRDKLLKLSEDYKEIRNILSEYFNKQENLIKQANKIIHKQGFDTFYRARMHYAEYYGFDKNKEQNLFIELEKYTIGLLLIIFILIDPLCLALLDPNVNYKMNIEPMTEPIDINFFENYLNNTSIIPQIMSSNFYKNFISTFDDYEEMNEATFNVIRNKYWDLSKLGDIQKQQHLLHPIEKIIYYILKENIRISHIYMLGGFEWYSTSIESELHGFSINSVEFTKYSSADYKFNQTRKNVYMSVIKSFDGDFLYLEHNELYSEYEINKLLEIEKHISEEKTKYYNILNRYIK